MTTVCDQQVLRIGHSPDPDDAFMWWPLANFPNGTGPGGKSYTPQIDTQGYDFVHVLEDIQSLNDRCEQAELEITALSIHQYPFVADEYALTSCGSSMGDGYGPMIVAKNPISIQDLAGKKLAMPGYRTTAWLGAQLMLAEAGVDVGQVDETHVAFDEIMAKVAAGEFDAGLIIHEGQITYQNLGLTKIVDLGEWWQETRGLPLPLGGNAIRRDVKDPSRVCRVLLESINHSLQNRDDAVAYALNYARDMGTDLADEFVGMYVNDWTLDYGDVGRAAVRRLLGDAAKAGLIPDPGEIDFVDPA